MLKFAGFPLSAWAFALRTWAAMMLGLYVAFWLQLENAYFAAVTVGILSLPTRGQAYQKALYRLLLTVVGVVASIIIAGLFAQSPRPLCDSLRELAWALRLCWRTFRWQPSRRCSPRRLHGSLRRCDTNRFATEHFLNWRRPGRGDRSGNCCARPGQRCVPCPEHPYDLSGKLAAVHQRVRAFAIAILRGESADPIQSANLLREITALHPDISALVIESSAGWARGAAGRTAAVALVAEVSAAGALTSLPVGDLAITSRRACASPGQRAGEQSRALRLHLQQHMQAGDADAHDALFACHALDLLTEDQRAQEAIEDLEADRRPPCHVRTPIYRSRRAAARNGLRAFLAVVISAILFSLGGWPFASFGLALVGVFWP